MLKFIATTENQKLIQSEDLNQNCRKVGKNCAETINSSRVAFFLTESIANSYESAITGQERTLVGQADESSCPFVQ